MKKTMNSEIALQNLGFITEEESLTKNNYVLKNNRIFSNTDANFDQMYSVKDMEYMIYFTFNECFYLIENYSDGRKSLIRKVYQLYDIVEEYYENSSEKDKVFEEMLDKLEEKLDTLYSRYILGLCTHYSEIFCNKIYDILYDCAKEVFYKKGIYARRIVEESSDSDTEEEDESKENNTGGATGGPRGERENESKEETTKNKED